MYIRSTQYSIRHALNRWLAVSMCSMVVLGPGCVSEPALDYEESTDPLNGNPRVIAQVTTDAVASQPRTMAEGTVQLVPVANVLKGGAFAVSAVALTGNDQGWIHVLPMLDPQAVQPDDKLYLASGFWLRSEDVALVAVDEDPGRLLSAEAARSKIAGLRGSMSEHANPLGVQLRLSKRTWQYRALTAGGELKLIERSGVGDLLVGAAADASRTDTMWTVHGADGYLVAFDADDAEAVCAADLDRCSQAGQTVLAGGVNLNIGWGVVGVIVVAAIVVFIVRRFMPQRATVRVQNTTKIEPATSLHAVTPTSGAPGVGGIPTSTPAPGPVDGPPPAFADIVQCWQPGSGECRYTLPVYQSTWYCMCHEPAQVSNEATLGIDINKDRDTSDLCGRLDFIPGSWSKACAVAPQIDTAEASPCQLTNCAYDVFLASDSVP